MRWAVAPVLLLGACGSLDAGPQQRFADLGTPLGVVAVADTGVSPQLQLPAGELALWLGAGPERCVTLGDAAGRPSDTDDAVEVAGLFLLGAEREPLHVVGVDCVTGARVREPAEVEVRVFALSAPPRGELSLRLVLSEHSALRGDAAAQQQLLALLASELAPAGVVPRLTDTRAVEGVPDELVFGPGALGPLRQVVQQVPPAPPRTVDVVFAGCLRYDDPFFGPPSAVAGYTPRVTGGGSPIDAVFLPGRVCDGFRDGPAPLDLEATAHVLAHELGHFLGLRHTVELDGRTDALDDTDEANLMHPNPGLASSHGLSPSQARVMRSHPFVRPLE